MTPDDLKAQRLLDALDLPAQAAEVLEHPEYRTPAFCLRYLEHCEDLRCRHPRAGLRAARIAPALAQRIPKRDCQGTRGWCSLQVRALAVVAAAQRSAFDDSGAEATFRVANFLFVEDADEPARAELLRQLAALRRDQRRFAEAERHADAAVRIYRQLGRHHLWGCALVDRGVVAICSDRPWKAMGDLLEALTLIERRESPRYYYSAAHHLVTALADDEGSNPLEALYWLRFAQRINDQPESSLSQIRLLWLEGRLLEKQGMLTESEHFLQTVRPRLLEHRTSRDYAMATLDLAGIYLKQERRQEVTMLAGELFPTFHQLRHDRDAVEGLKRFHRAASTEEELSLELVSSIRSILRARTHDDPSVARD